MGSFSPSTYNWGSQPIRFPIVHWAFGLSYWLICSTSFPSTISFSRLPYSQDSQAPQQTRSSSTTTTTATNYNTINNEQDNDGGHQARLSSTFPGYYEHNETSGADHRTAVACRSVK